MSSETDVDGLNLLPDPIPIDTRLYAGLRAAIDGVDVVGLFQRIAALERQLAEATAEREAAREALKKGTDENTAMNTLHAVSHEGDPCYWCYTPHDEVAPGPCPAFVGVRPPRMGEWFLGYDMRPQQARFDFTEQCFPIFSRYPFARRQP